MPNKYTEATKIFATIYISLLLVLIVALVMVLLFSVGVL